jgi:ankyrin repeat protein
MECLFDLGQPYFAAWRQLYDIDGTFNAPHFSHIMHNHSSKSAAPLYYAALCGFQDLVDRLIVMYPEHLKTNGGRYGTPALAALAGKHFDVAELLYHNGSSVDFSDVCQSPLHSAAYNGDLKMVQVLLGYKANPNSKNSIGGTPLHGATNGYQHPIRTGKRTEIVRLLLEYGANPNLGTYSYTPLHFASEAGNLEVVRALLEYGADIEPVNGDGKTAFQVALEERHDEIMKMLSDHGAQDMAVLS